MSLPYMHQQNCPAQTDSHIYLRLDVFSFALSASCSECTAGSVGGELAAVSPEQCIACSAGTYAAPNGTVCLPCPGALFLSLFASLLHRSPILLLLDAADANSCGYCNGPLTYSRLLKHTHILFVQLYVPSQQGFARKLSQHRRLSMREGLPRPWGSSFPPLSSLSLSLPSPTKKARTCTHTSKRFI